jgi:hypothetical protein
MTGKTNDELSKVVEHHERLIGQGQVMLVLGLLVELLIAFYYLHGKTVVERWGPFIADVLVFGGVFIEVHAGRKSGDARAELQRRSEEKAAEFNLLAAQANERAKNAEVELVKLQAQLAPRELTKAQYDRLQKLKGIVSAINITTPSDQDAVQYAAQIAHALGDAGIQVTICAQRLGMTWPELYVVLPQPSTDYAAEPLYRAFHEGGISVGCGPRTRVPMADLPADVPVLMVGEKAKRFSKPPFVAYLNGPETPVVWETPP